MKQQLTDLRAAMKRAGVDWYMIPSSDDHASEYVGEYYRCRAWVSGFTGSAGTLVVGTDEAWLWTDGRYFLQAGQQLEGSGIGLMRDREPGVPTIHEYLQAHAAGQTLGLDGRMVSCTEAKKLEACGLTLRSDLDLVGEIWTDRPAMSAAPVFELGLECTGKSRADKLAEIRAELKKSGADALLLSSLMDVCWLLNIRGGDVACTPVVLSFVLLTQEDCRLFVNDAAIPQTVREALAQDGVTLCPYEAVYEAAAALPEGITLRMNTHVVSSALAARVPQGVTVQDGADPTQLPKACKNAVECANFREAHVRDGVAVTRFMYWLKHHVGKEPMDELSVAEKLEAFRREQPDYMGPSFNPIMGYGPHGAIIHYGATAETNIPLEPRSFLLSDTGGHYLQGTTDITRTFALGPLTGEEKHAYTLVLRGHLLMGAAVFPEGASGLTIDILARSAMWKEHLNYNHGTGHGVGYLLSVHEGPQNVRWRGAPPEALRPGMVLSDEPGLYLEGKFGVRLENLVLCAEDGESEYGRFLRLEHLTMVPWDLDAVAVEEMTAEEKALLNAYHAQVREAVRPHLPAEEAEWLDHATRAI